MDVFKNENDMRIVKKEEYMNYIKEHIKNVKIAYDEFYTNDWLGKGTDPEIRSAVVSLLDKGSIKNHDMSKYSDEEFEPYRKQFYSINKEEKESSEDEFEEAWKHHYMCNDHHPEYWYDDNGPTPMPLECIIHMICDWEAMSYKFGGSSKQWYNENKEKVSAKLHKDTKEILERILDLYCRYE